MFQENKIWIANNDAGEKITILPKMANRHGLIAGATGTGKSVSLKVMAESFSAMGTPVFIADVKGDLAGLLCPGGDSTEARERIERLGLDGEGFSYQGFPTVFWDIFGKKGIPLRTTISEIGPLLLARILDLNDLQSDILTIVFKIADDQDLLLIDTKDLKAMLGYVQENSKELAESYGKISSASIGAITRALVALEFAGGEDFFGEPALNILDWLTTSSDGKGMIHILDSESLVNNGRLYSTFLLWLLSELFETLPEVGDSEKPKLVFFFDEAHLLFKDASKPLMEKIEQVIKLIRSKGVGIYFVTQNPGDIPDGVLSQLGNKVQHALRAYTPSDQKKVKAAAQAFRVNPNFDTEEVLTNLGTGEALISVLDDDGIPQVVQKATILPPLSRLGTITEAERNACIQNSLLYSKYAQAVDPDSAYEFLQRMGISAKEAQEKEKKEAAKSKERDRAVKSVGSSVAGTVGREVGKQVGKNFGSFGKTLGGNVGASLGRGLLNTLFRK